MPNEKRHSVSRTLPTVSSQCVSRYRDLFTTETKELSCYVTTFPLVFFAWPMIQSGYEMDDSNFVGCGIYVYIIKLVCVCVCVCVCVNACVVCVNACVCA